MRPSGSNTDVEDRLHRLADGLEAPATTTALLSIDRRTRSLRRRRLVGVAAAMGVVVASTVGGLTVFASDGSSDIDVEVQDPAGEDGLPAFTLDLDGWQVIAARDEPDVAWGIGPPLPADDSTEALQVFRVPGDPAGPSISVHHVSTDGLAGVQLEVDVTVGGRPGRAQVQDGAVTVVWRIHDGRTQVSLRAFGLPLDQVLEFAEGLRPTDDDIASPPGPDDRFGFDATASVAGLEEEPPLGTRPARVDRRIIRLAKGIGDRPSLVKITVEDVGRRVFEEDLANANANAWSEATVDGVPATMLIRGPDGPHALVAGELMWMADDVTRVRVTAHRVTREELTAIAGGVHSVSVDEWADILAVAPERVDIADPPEAPGG
jgi:hypothetical protein